MVAAWQQILGLIPQGVLTLTAIVGVILIVMGLIGWLWRKRTGGGGISGFPVMMVFLGALLALPTLLMEPLLLFIEGFIQVVVALVKSAAGIL